MQYDNANKVPNHFIGSVSHFIMDEIDRALKLNNLTIGRIVQRPIDELVKYHKRLLESKV